MSVGTQTTDAASVPRKPVPRRGEILITSDGFRALELRLDDLQTARTEEYSERLREAREYGEAGSNDEYLAILEDEAVVDSQIAQLKELLARARVVDEKAVRSGTVVIGSTVAVEDERSRTVHRYRIVGPLDAGGDGAVTAGSPIGRALLGRKAGDAVTVELPRGGTRELHVVAVEPSLDSKVA